MSVGIIRVQKFTAGSVKGIEVHDKREKNGVSHSNGDIDWSRSRLNYSMRTEPSLTFYNRVKKRIKQLALPRAVRKDAIVMAQVLVTSDKKFFDGLTELERKQFFEDSYQYLQSVYGQENIISATVHLDETTPHLHFNFVPVTADNRLSAKTLINRTFLRKQQTDFYEQVGKKWGLERGKEGSETKHLTTVEYKKQKAVEEELENANKMLHKTEEAILSAKKELDSLDREIGLAEDEKAYLETKQGTKEFAQLKKFVASSKIAPLYQDFLDQLSKEKKRAKNER